MALWKHPRSIRYNAHKKLKTNMSTKQIGRGPPMQGTAHVMMVDRASDDMLRSRNIVGVYNKGLSIMMIFLKPCMS